MDFGLTYMITIAACYMLSGECAVVQFSVEPRGMLISECVKSFKPVNPDKNVVMVVKACGIRIDV